MSASRGESIANLLQRSRRGRQRGRQSAGEQAGDGGEQTADADVTPTARCISITKETINSADVGRLMTIFLNRDQESKEEDTAESTLFDWLQMVRDSTLMRPSSENILPPVIYECIVRIIEEHRSLRLSMEAFDLLQTLQRAHPAIFPVASENETGASPLTVHVVENAWTPQDRPQQLPETLAGARRRKGVQEQRLDSLCENLASDLAEERRKQSETVRDPYGDNTAAASDGVEADSMVQGSREGKGRAVSKTKAGERKRKSRGDAEEIEDVPFLHQLQKLDTVLLVAHHLSFFNRDFTLREKLFRVSGDDCIVRSSLAFRLFENLGAVERDRLWKSLLNIVLACAPSYEDEHISSEVTEAKQGEGRTNSRKATVAGSGRRQALPADLWHLSMGRRALCASIQSFVTSVLAIYSAIEMEQTFVRNSVRTRLSTRLMHSCLNAESNQFSWFVETMPNGLQKILFLKDLLKEMSGRDIECEGDNAQAWLELSKGLLLKEVLTILKKSRPDRRDMLCIVFRTAVQGVILSTADKAMWSDVSKTTSEFCSTVLSLRKPGNVYAVLDSVEQLSDLLLAT